MTFSHTSVLLYETVDSLNIRPDGIYVDGTLGGEDMPPWCSAGWERAEG